MKRRPENGQAGAEVTAIEVTPEMIEAGVDVVMSYTEEELTREGQPLRDALVAIYSAMRSLSHIPENGHEGANLAQIVF